MVLSLILKNDQNIRDCQRVQHKWKIIAWYALKKEEKKTWALKDFKEVIFQKYI